MGFLNGPVTHGETRIPRILFCGLQLVRFDDGADLGAAGAAAGAGLYGFADSSNPGG
jgi:hypothetical protein